MKFGFPCFFAIWPGGRRCANCRNAHFLRGTVMKAYSHEKHAKKNYGKIKTKKQKKSSDPWARSGERPGWGHGSELLFFWFFHGFLQFGQNLEKTKKQKVQTHGQGLGRGLAGDMGLNFLFFFVFVVFPWFFAVWPKPRENKKKIRPMGKVWGEAWLGTWVWTFPRMRSKGSRFTLWVLGLRVCSLDVAFTVATVRNRSQPSATVRARTIWPCLWEVLQEWLFWRFQTCRCFVSRGRRMQAWHFVTFRRVLERVESRFAWQAQYFCDVFRRCVAFSWQAQHFGRVHRHFSWQAQHFRRVVLRVFCKSHWQGCVKWRQGANSVACVAFCDMYWKLTEASHETSILRLQIFRF